MTTAISKPQRNRSLFFASAQFLAKKIEAYLVSVVLLGLLTMPSATNAQEIISFLKNTGQPDGVTAGSSNDYSQSFNISATNIKGQEGGFTLTSVDVEFVVVDGTQPTYTMEIRKTNLETDPTDLVVTLEAPTTLVNGINTFTVPNNGVVLDERFYAIVWDVSATGTAGAVKLQLTTSSSTEDVKHVNWDLDIAGKTRAYDSSVTDWPSAATAWKVDIKGWATDNPTVDLNVGERASVPVKTNLELVATATDPDGGTIASYEWEARTTTDVTDQVLTINDTDPSKATFNYNSDDWSSFDVTLTVTDNENEQVTFELLLYATTAASRDSSFSGLVITDADDSALTLDPTFTSTTFEYRTTLNHATATIKVNPTKGNANALLPKTDLTRSDNTTDINPYLQPNQFPKTFTGLTPGDNRVLFQIGSVDGSSTSEYTVTVKRAVAPTAAIDPSTDQSVPAGTDLALTGSGSDSDGGTVTYSWAVTDSSDNAVTNALTVSPTDSTMATFNGSAVGTYTVTLTVTDDESVTATATVSVTVTAAPPTATITPSGTVNSQTGTDLTLTGTGTDPDGGTVTYAWTASDGTNTVTSAVLTGTDTATTTFNAATAGTYTVTLTVTDDESDTATATVMVVVAATIPPTASITPSGTATVAARADLALTGAATDPDGGTVTNFSWAVTDSSGTAVNGVLTVNPNDSKLATFNALTLGTYTVTLTVTDNESETATATLVVTVTLPDERLVISTTTVSVDENGGTDTWTIKLNTQPTGTVTVAIVSGATSVATVSPASLTFTTTTWSTEQTVTATGVDDSLDNATDRTSTVTHTASGANYGDAALVETVTVTAVDNDDPGIRVSESMLSVAEAGGTGTWTVRLDSQPTGNVTVSLANGTPGTATVAPTSLTFTTTDWSTEQTVTATAVDDNFDNAADRTTIVTHTATGGGYASVSAATVTVTATDDDIKGILVDPTELTVSEGNVVTYNIRLTSEPTADVTITLSSVQVTGMRAAAVAQSNRLFFGSQNWNTSQVVRVGVENDDTPEADSTLQFVHSPSGGGYDDVSDVVVNVFVPGYSVSDSTPPMLSFMVPTSGTIMVPEGTGTEVPAGIQLQFSQAQTANVVMTPATLPTEKPPGFQAGDVAVNIELAGDVQPTGNVTICLPSVGGGGVYRWDDDATPPVWTVLPPPPASFTPPGPDYACGVTNQFSVFTTGAEPPPGLSVSSPANVEKMRLAQIGRVLGGQVATTVQNRLNASRETGFKATMAGQALPSFDEISNVSSYSTPPHDSDTGFAGTRDWDNTQVQSLTEQSLLTGSNFSLTDKFLGAGSVSIWGQASITGFDGEGLDDGQMTSGFFGADWTSDDLTAGVALSLNRGKGTWTSEDTEAEDFRSSLTGIHPYFGYELSNRLSVWGVAGYGEGDIETMNGDETASADTDMLMLAGGTSGDLDSSGLPESITNIVGDDVSLTLNSDVLWVRMGTDSEDASASRLRVAVEASTQMTTADGIKLKPMGEVGLRFDGGDAETGFGLDIGGGVGWSDASRGMSAELRGRALLTHASDDLREQSISGSFGWDANPRSAEGANLTVKYIVGDSTTGGVKEMFTRDTLNAAETIGGNLDNHRMEIRLGYGMPVWGGRFIGTPQTTFGYSNDDRDVSLGWRMTLVDRFSVRGTGSFGLSLEARRSESASDGYRPEDEIVFRLRTQF